MMKYLPPLFALLFASPAHAQQFWKKSDLLAEMFATSERVEAQKFTLSPENLEQFKTTVGYTPPRTDYTFYVATTAGEVDGYVLFDDQIGQHEPITFAVQLSVDVVVVRQEVVVYREKYGAEVRHPRFRAQFVGKTAADPVSPSVDIDGVSGATYSSRSIAMGVKRALLLTKMFTERQAAPSPPVDGPVGN